MKSLLTFVAGLAIGAGVSWVYHKNRYEEMVKDEIDELRAHAKEKKTKSSYKYEGEKMTKEEYDRKLEEEKKMAYDEDMGRVHSLVRENRYTSCEDENLNKETEFPFVVSPEEFATVPLFDTDTFYYHADDIISNDNQEMLDIDEIQRLFGMTALEIKERFGVYEDDAVYIRNMALKCDYEILRDEGDYTRRNGD